MGDEEVLVIGKKGSGKTAIFKRVLASSGYDVLTAGHTFSDYPWDYHAKQARIGIPDFDKFTHSWKYLILLTAAKLLLQDQALPYNEDSQHALEKLEGFVVDTYGSADLDVREIFTPNRHLKLKPNFQINIGLLSGGVSPESVPMEYLPAVIQDVNKNLLQYALDSFHPEHRYYVCFDELDLGFDPKSPDYISRLTGLLLACRDINVAARSSGKRFCVAVFLRDDIYETLQFEDKNKLTENYRSLIEWDTLRANKTLKGLMEKRFQAVLATEENEHVSWDDVFDEDQEMPGHQSKYQHILDRTYLRPRDMIKFVNTVLERYKEFNRSAVEPNLKFSNKNIHDSRMEYSQYLGSELNDEILKHVPEYTKYLELIRSIGHWHFESKPFESVVSKRQDLVGEETSTSILEKLYDYSIIGFYRAGGGGYGGSEYVFRYKEPPIKFDSTASRFRVHTGLIEMLGLKKTTAQDDGAEVSGESEEAAVT